MKFFISSIFNRGFYILVRLLDTKFNWSNKNVQVIKLGNEITTFYRDHDHNIDRFRYESKIKRNGNFKVSKLCGVRRV